MGVDSCELNRSALAEKYEWKESEGNIPDGWKYRVVKISPSLQRVFFITTDGTSLVGKIQAIDFLKKNDYSEEKIKAFATDAIFMNGCKEDPNLPEGWKYKKVKHSSGKKITMFLPPTSIDFLSRGRALEFLEENHSSQSDLVKIKYFENKKNQSKKKSVEHDWSENNALPEGWKYRIVTKKSGNQMVFFQTRDGPNLAGRMQAIEFLQKNNYSEEKIKAFATSPLFMKECKEDPLLPEGWKYKIGKTSKGISVFMFLPPSSLNFMGRHAVLEYIKKNNADAKDTEKIERFLKYNISEFHSRNYTWQSDKTIPEGWKYRISKNKNGNEMMFFRTPEGLTLAGKIQAIKYMKGKNYDQKEIQMVESGFPSSTSSSSTHQWKCDPSIPQGWKLRVQAFTDGRCRTFYLPPNGTSSLGRLQAIKYMKEKNYDQKDIQMVESGFSSSTHQWKDDPSIPSRWKLRVQAVKDGRFRTFYLPPNGTSSLGRLQAIRKMKMENYNEQDIRKLDTTSRDWISDSKSLPEGWKYRYVSKKSGYLVYFFMTPDGNKLAGKKQMLQFLKENAFADDDVKKVHALVGSVKCKKRKKHVRKYNWLVNESLPEGWKYRYVSKKSGYLVYFFMTPDGNKLAGKKQMLQFLKENDFAEDDVKKVHALLGSVKCEKRKKHIRKYNWLVNDNIPEGWKYRIVRLRSGHSRMFFMIPNGTKLAGKTQAIKYMTGNNYDQKEIQKIESGFSSSTSSSSTHQWKDDPSIPTGWKLRVQAFTDGRSRTFYLPPNGTSSLGRLQAINQMKLENYNEQDVKKLDKTSSDWISDSKNLPEGWKYRYVSKKSGYFGYYFMSPDGNKLAGKKQMLQFLKENDFAEDDVKKVHALLGSMKWRKRHTRKYNWLVNDNIPEGWKCRSVRQRNGHSRMFFLKPDGTKLRGRIQLLEFLKENNFHTDVVRKAKLLFQKGLNKERKTKKNWEEDDSVPAGWKYKIVGDGHGGKRRVYKTGNGLTLVGKRAAAVYMEKQNYSKDDIRRVEPEKEMVNATQIGNNWIDDENLPSGWKYQSGQKSVERSGLIMNSQGKIFKSRVDAIKSMIAEDFAPEDILKAWMTLKVEGWLYLEGLPDGWRVKLGDATFIYLSPQMEMFNAVEDIEQSLNYDDELETIRIFSKSLIRPSSNVSDAVIDKTDRTLEETNEKPTLDKSDAIEEESDDNKGVPDVTLEETCPENSDNDENPAIAKKIPQDWDTEVGRKLRKSDGSFLCSECGFSTLTKVNAISHVQSNHVDGFVGYECDECGKVSPTIKTLESHLIKYHSVSVPKYLARNIIVK